MSLRLCGAIIIGNGLVGTTGSGIYAPMSLAPQSNPLILSNGNVAFGVAYSIQLVNGGFTNQIVAGNYTLRQGPYAVSITVPDTTNVLYLTNLFTGGLYSNYVYQAAPAVYGTKVDSNDLTAGFLSSKLASSNGISWAVVTNGGGEQLLLIDNSGGFSGAALTNWIGALSTNATNFAQGIGTAVTNWVGVISTNATNDVVSTSNALYALIGSGGFSGAALTNWIGALSTNATNFAAQSVGQNLTNWAGVLSTNATNFAESAGSTITNWTGTLSTNATNFAQGIGTAMTNNFQWGLQALSNYFNQATGYPAVQGAKTNVGLDFSAGHRWMTLTNNICWTNTLNAVANEPNDAIVFINGGAGGPYQMSWISGVTLNGTFTTNGLVITNSTGYWQMSVSQQGNNNQASNTVYAIAPPNN